MCKNNEVAEYGRRNWQSKITSAFNLPCKYVLHTVGPIVRGRLCKEDEEKLASCYRSCLELAEQSGVKSIAFVVYQQGNSISQMKGQLKLQ